jgi:hypothetical protein
MVEGIAELVTARRARLMSTIRRLEDDELRFQVQQSDGDSERTIEEWHDYVENLDRDLRASRDRSRHEEFPTDELVQAQRFEYLCSVGRKGYEGGVKVA